MFSVYLSVSSPSSLSIDLETAADATVIDYVNDDPSFSTELPGKQPPL
jgi:hypothetical protein